MQWVNDEFNMECIKIKGNKCWIKETWLSTDSDEEHSKTSMYEIHEGDNCDILEDPEYAGEWYGQLSVNAAINLDEFYPDYWDKVLGESVNISSKDIVKMINDINKSDDNSRKKVTSITSILGKINDGFILELSRDGSSVGLNLERDGYNWIDPEGGYKYSTYDIADEIVNGRYKVVYGIIDPSTLKKSVHTYNRDIPSMWRK